MINLNADVVLLEEESIFGISKNIFNKVEYPHFEIAESEKIEIKQK